MNPSKVEAAREDLERKAILGDFEWAHEYIENDLISWLKEKSEEIQERYTWTAEEREQGIVPTPLAVDHPKLWALHPDSSLDTSEKLGAIGGIDDLVHRHWSTAREWRDALAEAEIETQDNKEGGGGRAPGRVWFDIAEVLQKSAGPDSLLWAEYETPTSGRGLTLRLTALDATLSLGADEEGPGIQPRYTPLNTVLEEGAMCLLLSATPQQRQDVSRFLDHRSVKTRNYPGEAPNPELNVAVEMKGGGVAKAIRGYREDAEMREDAERKLKACISAVGGNCHVVARNKDEYFAVRKAVDLDAERIHYCRDAESLGTQWQEGWTADENATIIFTGPPYLPPTAWAALKGWTQDETGPTDAMNASRRWQTERMAVEFLQTAGRGPKLWPRDERRIGQVILLNGKYALEDLKRYAETFHMDVTWETVDPDRRKIQDRGPMLAQGARGEVPLPPYARKLYSYDWPKGEWSANDAVEADLMSAETARKWNKWLVEQGLAEQHRKGGANGRTRFYRLVNKPD